MMSYLPEHFLSRQVSHFLFSIFCTHENDNEYSQNASALLKCKKLVLNSKFLTGFGRAFCCKSACSYLFFHSILSEFHLIWPIQKCCGTERQEKFGKRLAKPELIEGDWLWMRAAGISKEELFVLVYRTSRNREGTKPMRPHIVTNIIVEISLKNI